MVIATIFGRSAIACAQAIDHATGGFRDIQGSAKSHPLMSVLSLT
jgi:hypothetical protein